MRRCWKTWGTGPWEMVEYVTDARRRVKAVEGHWRKTPEFSEMVWHDIPKESTRLANFIAGTLDTGIFNSDSIQAMKGDPVDGLTFMVFPRGIIQMMWHEGLHYTPGLPADADEFFNNYPNLCDDSACGATPDV